MRRPRLSDNAWLVLNAYPNAMKILQALDNIRADSYPLQDWDDLESALGGGSRTVELARLEPPGRIRGLLPETWFPIRSAEDFAQKAAALDMARERLRGAVPATQLDRPVG
jgi:hypothetical protein